ncbi:unnamed protein product [Hymenolepis diminuta]|uniref:BTB domain-containing protein n=1 Tax=Hymenolepis diminuta TaxID=6216 RepID=A0A564YLN2_HYMDI|nr:unnamed protein product [Hymenolepis diminuta]
MMEMQDVEASGHWTSLIFFGQHLNIQSMTRAGVELFLKVNSQLMGGAVPRRQNPITLQSLCAYEAEPKLKNGEFAHRNSHKRRRQTRSILMNNLEIVNPDANSNCFSRFRRMRARLERLDIFINTKEGEEVGAHRIALSASFPLFGKYLSGNDVVHVQLSRFPHEVVNATVEYAYGGIENISPEVALRLYLLTHSPQNKALVDGCTKFLCVRIEETNVSEVWSAANATKNEDLIGVCAPLVAMNWEMFRISRLFHATTEIKGIMFLLGCPRMSQKSAKLIVKALIEWRNASRDDEVRTARTTAFRDMVSLLGIQDTPDLINDLFAEDIDIPVEWRRWLAERRKTAKRQLIASSLMPSSSTEAKDNPLSISQEMLATFDYIENKLQIYILNPECSEVEIEHQLPIEEMRNFISYIVRQTGFHGWLDENHHHNRMDPMDPLTGRMSPLSDLINAR